MNNAVFLLVSIFCTFFAFAYGQTCVAFYTGCSTPSAQYTIIFNSCGACAGASVYVFEGGAEGFSIQVTGTSPAWFVVPPGCTGSQVFSFGATSCLNYPQTLTMRTDASSLYGCSGTTSSTSCYYPQSPGTFLTFTTLTDNSVYSAESALHPAGTSTCACQPTPSSSTPCNFVSSCEAPVPGNTFNSAARRSEKYQAFQKDLINFNITHPGKIPEKLLSAYL